MVDSVLDSDEEGDVPGQTPHLINDNIDVTESPAMVNKIVYVLIR
jgi:hypothetical protein